MIVIAALFLLFAMLELTAKGFGQRRPVDSQRMAVNFGLGFFNAGMELLIPVGTLAAAIYASEREWGLFNRIEAPAAAIMMTAFLIRSFLFYWLHRAFHRFEWMWRIHKVHHSDTEFDITVSVRQHPFSVIIGLCLYIPAVMLLGLPAWATILVDLLMLAAFYWEHVDAPLQPKIAKTLGWVFMTPNIHRVHHSAHQPETDSNFGTGLVIWDRLFGTFVPPESATVERIGLGDADDAISRDIGKQLLMPIPRR